MVGSVDDVDRRGCTIALTGARAASRIRVPPPLTATAMNPRHHRLGAILLLCLMGCAVQPAPPPTVGQLLGAARHALGADSVVVHTVATEAVVSAPSGGFRSTVRAAGGGRFRIALGATIGGVDEAGGWRCDSSGTPGPLDDATRTVLHGHDLHMLILEPTGWLRRPAVAASRRWGTDSVLAIEFRDELDAPLTVFYRIEDTLPVGLQLANHDGVGGRDVSVFLDDWRPVSGLTLFGTATFVQDGNEFVHRYRRLVVNSAEGSDLRRTCSDPWVGVAGPGDRGPVASGG
jgi:hypothetical protein